MSVSKIEWTEQTWNPIVGCSIVSPGCTNCYAMAMAARIDKMTLQSHYEGLTKKVNGKDVWTGKLARAGGHAFFAPLRRHKPTTYFVNSMGDLFHEECPDEWILSVLDVIRRTSFDGGGNCGKIGRGFGQHTYQLLTKRAARMASFMKRLRFESVRGLYLSDDGKRAIVLKNLWLGVSTERQQEADERIPLLLQTPAAVRFISAEPLLGPIELHPLACWTNSLTSSTGPNLDWVIVGGESGPGARPMHPDWARALRDQCAAARVPFFFKQWGNFIPESCAARDHQGAHTSQTFGKSCIKRDDEIFWIVGKKAAGRLLDGVEHNGFPQVRR